MISDILQTIMGDAQGFARVSETLRARCFLGSAVSDDVFRPDTMTDFLLQVAERVVDSARTKGVVNEEELDVLLCGTYYVSGFGPRSSLDFDDEVIKRISRDAAPQALCGDRITPNPEFVSYLVERLLTEIEEKHSTDSKYRLAVHVVFTAASNWLREARSENIFNEEQAMGVLEILAKRLCLSVKPSEQYLH